MKLINSHKHIADYSENTNCLTMHELILW